MSSYTPFITSISKFQLQQKYPTPVDLIPFQLDKIGIYVMRTSRFSEVIKVMLNEISQRTQKITQGSKNMIELNYNKIIEILPFMKKSILNHDKQFENRLKCEKHFNDIDRNLKEIQPLIKTMKDIQLIQSQDKIIEKITSVTQSIDKINEIMSTIKNSYGNDLIKISKQDKDVSNQIANSLSSLDHFYISILSLLPNLKETPNVYQQIQSQLSSFDSSIINLLEAKRNNTDNILKATSVFAKQILVLINTLSSIQKSVCNSADFTQASIALILTLRSIHTLETKIFSDFINPLLEQFASNYLNNKPMDDLLKISHDLLIKTREKIAPLGRNYIACYGALASLIPKSQSDNELLALTISGLIRYASTLLPDYITGENFLISLIQKIGIIMRSLFKQSKELIQKLILCIESNIGYFKDSLLNEVNFYLNEIKNVDDFDLEAPSFIIIQQRYYDSLIALPSSFEKLIEDPKDIPLDSKSQLNEILEQLKSLGNKFTSWVNQFYLAVFSIVVLKSQNIESVLSFPTAIFSLSGNKKELKDILTITCEIQNILKTTPSIIFYDFDDIYKLINNILDLTNKSYAFSEIANNNTSQMSQLFKQSSDVLKRLISNLPYYLTSLKSFTKNENNDIYLCSLIGCFSNSIQQIQNLKPIINKPDSSTCYFLSTIFTFINICNGIMQYQTKLDPNLIAKMKEIKSVVNIVWPIVNSLACGDKTVDTTHLPGCLATITKLINELLDIIKLYPQPSLSYEIPNGVGDFRRYESLMSNMSSSTLKQTATFLLHIMKKCSSSDARSATCSWFDETQVTVLEVKKAANNMNESIIELLKSITSDHSKFIKCFATLSVSLCIYSNTYGKTIEPMILKVNQKFIELVYEFLDSEANLQNMLMRIYGHIEYILAILPISKLKQNDVDQYLCDTIKKIIISLNDFRNNKGEQLLNKLSAVSSIKQLHAFYQIYPQENKLDAEEIFELIIANNFVIAKSTNDIYIKRFSEKLLQLSPSLFHLIDRIRDRDTLCDYIYDKADMFYENVNQILKLAKMQCTDKKMFYELLKSNAICMSDAAVLTMHSLMISSLAFTPLSLTFINCCCELFIAFKEFVDITIKIPEKPKEDMSSELRRINRKMIKNFDFFITLVESPQQQSSEYTSFETTKNKMYTELAAVVIQLERLIQHVSNSLVPEMYNDIRKEIILNIQDSIVQLNSSVTNVRSKAFGESSVKLGSLMTKFESKINSLILVSEKIIFDDNFYTMPLYTSYNEVCSVILDISSLNLLLSDRIIISPDKESAKKVPGDYTAPSLPKTALPLSEAYQSLILSKSQVDETIDSFKSTIEIALVTSNEILNSIIEVKNASVNFVEKAMNMTVATVDPHSQVSQQSSIHTFINSINGLLSATRNRLLRTPNFEQDMDDAISFYTSSLNKCMGLAETASKIEIVVDEDDSLDDVSKELNATASLIETMTSKLKEYESQVNIEAIELEDKENEQFIPDLKAAAGTFPAFLISCTAPIFAASKGVINRAKEITSNLIKTNGKIQNEGGLIRAAQNLSEASGLILTCAEILVSGGDDDAEFKVIAASRIIKASIAALVSQVLSKGGDPQGIMNKHVKEVAKYSDKIIKSAESLANEKIVKDESKKGGKRNNNKMIMKLNLQQVINQQRKQLQEEERNLFQYRRK